MSTKHWRRPEIRDRAAQAHAVVDAGVVHHAVDAAVLLQHGGNGGADGRLVRHLAGKAVGAPALRLQSGHERVRLGGVAAEDAGDGALGGKAPGDGFADALGAAGDEDDLVFQFEVHGGVRDGPGCRAEF